MARTANSANLTAKRLSPPKSLSRAVRAVFKSLVAAVSADHFSQVDVPLLVEYARAAVLAETAAAKLELEGAVVDGKASPWLIVQEKSVRSLTALSARLRISPQSRFDRLKAGSNARDPAFVFDDEDDLLARPE